MSLDLPVIETTPALKPPDSLVVRLGHMRVIAELPYDGDVRPGCGAKVVCRHARGTEIGEILTTTCSHGGCPQSITRDKAQEYIQNSRGGQYPFPTEGRFLRLPPPKDLTGSGKSTPPGRERPLLQAVLPQLGLPIKLGKANLLPGGKRPLSSFGTGPGGFPGAG